MSRRGGDPWSVHPTTYVVCSPRDKGPIRGVIVPTGETFTWRAIDRDGVTEEFKAAEGIGPLRAAALWLSDRPPITDEEALKRLTDSLRPWGVPEDLVLRNRER